MVHGLVLVITVGRVDISCLSIFVLTRRQLELRMLRWWREEVGEELLVAVIQIMDEMVHEGLFPLRW